MTDATTFSQMHPALRRLAECFCTYDLTDGFCRPDDAGRCKCWKRASMMIEATGMSSQACQWILKNKKRIEQEAAK